LPAMGLRDTVEQVVRKGMERAAKTVVASTPA
jgi:hypothetical protein